MTAPHDPIVTVVVPGFDVEEYAGEAIASLEAQTFRAWTAILVDDASSDATGAVFDDAAARDPRFRVVHLDRRLGLGAARNAGLDLVTTSLVGFLDADDRLRPDALDALVRTITASGSEVAVGAYVRLRPSGAGAYEPGDVQPWVAAATHPGRTGTSLAEHPDLAGNIVAWSKLSRIDLWRREGVRFPEGRAYEDQVVAQLLYTRARGIDVVPDVVVEWRERADGSSITQRTADPAILTDYLDALRGGIAVLESAGLDAAVQSRVALIQHLDLPPLLTIARDHPDDRYRRILGSFVRDLLARDADPVTDLTQPTAAATLW
ncbi:glycosyltransferase family 2 protein [Microbacter sp. GSS18]|nr:glycosyltransferase family 2 protein [Microbacter sp. GSS18]